MNDKIQDFIWMKRVLASSPLPTAQSIKRNSNMNKIEGKKHCSQLNIFLKFYRIKGPLNHICYNNRCGLKDFFNYS